MKILHVDTAMEWRGGQNQIVLTAAGQASRGHDVRILANAGGQLAARAANAGLAVRPVVFGRGDISWRTLRAVRHAMKAGAPDVLHVHESHGLLAALLVARSADPAPRVIASRRVDFPLGLASRLKYQPVDRVLAVSSAVRDVLLRGGLPPAKIRVVHEGVPDRPALPGGEEALLTLGVPRDAPLVGNVAQLVDHKDHATLIRAAAIVHRTLPQCHFLICGDGPLRSQLVSLAESLGVGRRVIFAGFRADLDALIPRFDVFALSSHLEGLGTSILDAMCFSRPVVATRAGGIADAVVDDETGRLVNPRDHEALAGVLLETLASRRTLHRYGAAGRSRFLQRFTSAAMVEATLTAYA